MNRNNIEKLAAEIVRGLCEFDGVDPEIEANRAARIDEVRRHVVMAMLWRDVVPAACKRSRRAAPDRVRITKPRPATVRANQEDQQ